MLTKRRKLQLHTQEDKAAAWRSSIQMSLELWKKQKKIQSNFFNYLRTPDEYAKEEKSKSGANVCKIILYENGFQIDEGEFQDYNDPKNKEFMKRLNDGYIPQ